MAVDSPISNSMFASCCSMKIDSSCSANRPSFLTLLSVRMCIPQPFFTYSLCRSGGQCLWHTLPPLALNITSYLNRTAAGAGVRALFNCFKVLIAFHPFLTASQTFYRANVEGIVASPMLMAFP